MAVKNLKAAGPDEPEEEVQPSMPRTAAEATATGIAPMIARRRTPPDDEPPDDEPPAAAEEDNAVSRSCRRRRAPCSACRFARLRSGTRGPPGR